MNKVTASLLGLFFMAANAQADVVTFANGSFDVNVSGQNWGESAGNVTLHLSYTDSTKTEIKVTGQATTNGSTTVISQVIPVSTSITVEAEGVRGYNGSNGRDGANGDNGANGWAGANGINGCPPSNGRDGGNGQPGTNGQDGTPGTNGGNGGNGGTILIDAPADQSELMLRVTGDSSAGSGGEAGRGGSGGAGGRGGIGGPGGRGGTNTCSPNPGSGGNGSTGGKGGAGGKIGPNGSSGSAGYSGANGSDGRAGANGSRGYDGEYGSSTFALLNSNGSAHNYNSPLRLSISSLQMIDQDQAGVLEPGEDLSLVSLTISNSSDMPTPSGQVVRVEFSSSDTLISIKSPELKIADPIPPGGSITKTFAMGAMVFEGVDQVNLIGTDATVTTQIFVNSVAVSDPVDSGFDFAWPLTVSSAQASQQLYFEEAQSVAYSIANIGTKNIGPNGDQVVTAQFSWNSQTIPGSDVTMTLSDGRSFTLAQPVKITDFTVDANSTLAVPVVVNIKNSQNALLGSGNLSLDLYLNDMGSQKSIKADDIGSAATSLAVAIDLTPVAFNVSIDVGSLKINCHYPNIALFHYYDMEHLTINKDAGSTVVKVQYSTKVLFTEHNSPVFQTDALSLVPFSRDLAEAQPTADTVVSFMNTVVAPLTQNGDSGDVFDSCSIEQ